MKLPVISGVIRRRVLLNYRAEAERVSVGKVIERVVAEVAK